MADFSAVLRKTIDGLSENTPAIRARVYDKARQTVESKLAAVSPPPAAAAADRQRRMLEEAITQVETEYAATDTPPPAEENEFDRIFADSDAADTHASEAGEPSEPDTQGEQPTPYPSHAPVGTEADHAEFESSGHAHEAAGGSADMGIDEPREERIIRPTPTRKRTNKVRMALIAMLVLLVALAGAGYAVWLNKAAFAELIGLEQLAPVGTDSDTGVGEEIDSDTGAADTSEPAPSADTDRQGQAEETDTSIASAETQPGDASEPPRKFTQRLLPNGEEVDAGPAQGESELGEGTSVAASTQGADQQDAEAQTGEAGADTAGDDSQSATVPVGQRAIFYEERTNAAQGSAEAGSVVWSVVRESPGNDLPPEPAIRAEASIPDKDVQLRMTIRRNADPSLPASHIVELIFLTPDDFEGGGIESVLRVAMKQSEQDTGNPLLGVPAKIADGFFLLALNDTKADLETNRTLLRRQEWIDIPIVYKSGRRALITLEKGVPGDKAFDQALDAWQSGSSG